MKADEKQLWLQYLPEHVSLYYVDYNENLDEEIEVLEESIVKNSLYPIMEDVLEAYDDRGIQEVQNILNDMRNRMESDGIAWDEEWEDEIRDAIYEKDSSSLLEDLLRNTHPVPAFYDLGMKYGGLYSADDDEVSRAVTQVCEALQIPLDDSDRVEAIRDILLSCGDDAYLRIYFKSCLDTLLCGVKDADFKTVQFKGLFTVALHDPMGGGGWSEEIKLDCKFKFNRKNLHHSDGADRYSYYDVYGCDAEGDEPRFSIHSSKQASETAESNIEAVKETERKYDETHRNGGCTFGDTRMARHRDVEYRNDFPCGWKCPHCGQFWID